MNKNITKLFKGRMIRLNYLSKGETNSITGEITATTKTRIIFNVNKNDLEIPIKYENIINIEELKKLNQKKPVEAKS